jgi:hypothetical protein
MDLPQCTQELQTMVPWTPMRLVERGALLFTGSIRFIMMMVGKGELLDNILEGYLP